VNDCIFCKIVAGEIPSTPLYADDELYAFNDINPKAPTHVLVIPTEHVDGVAALDERPELLGRLMARAVKLARELGLEEPGYRLVINQGEDGGQSVGHVHVHLLGGRPLNWPPG
jgi:histidine triad (HIT) family protein